MRYRKDDPVIVSLTEAIQTGDLESLARLLREHPGLASARIDGQQGRSRTPLHQATDWPGQFPNGPAVVRALVAAGADVNAPVEGSSSETALHFAASSDDVDVAEALIAAGADIEARGASIAGGTPLDDAVGYGCWQVAGLLVRHGARVEKLWHAAALGMISRMEELFASSPPPTTQEINDAFWQACHGGQRRAAEYLLARGADMNWIPDYNKATPLEAVAVLETRRQTLATWLREQLARSGAAPPTG